MNVLGLRGFNYKLDFCSFIVMVYSCQENVRSVAHRAEIKTSYMRDQRGKSSFFNLCVRRVALLIGVCGGGLIDGLIACSSTWRDEGVGGERRPVENEGL